MWADGYSPSTNWGCRCCVPGDKGTAHGIWSVVKNNWSPPEIFIIFIKIQIYLISNINIISKIKNILNFGNYKDF